jgi:hypothetical protein
MSAEASTAKSDLVRWSSRDWAGVVALVLVAQALLVLALSERRARAKIVQASPTEVTLNSAPKTGDPLLQFELQTQLFFIEPNANGFSGYAWLQPPERNYLNLSNQPAPELLRFADARRLIGSEPVPAAPVPQPASARSILPFTPPPLLGDLRPPASTLEVDGFEGRTLLNSPILKPQRHSDVLDSSVIQAGVDSDGIPRFTQLLDSSGSKVADDEALAIARRSRFSRDGGADEELQKLAWGKLIFHWHTLELTNKAAAPR